MGCPAWQVRLTGGDWTINFASATNPVIAKDDPMSNESIERAFEEGTPIDRAMNRAFYDAVRFHRMHRVPMTMWVDGGMKLVDPYDVSLPDEVESHTHEGSDSE